MSQERETQLWHQFDHALLKVIAGEELSDEERLLIQAYCLRGEAAFYPIKRDFGTLSRAYDLLEMQGGN